MTAPKKPTGGVMNTVSKLAVLDISAPPAAMQMVVSLPAPDLTPAERRLLEAFRATDDEGQEDATQVMQNWARDFPRRHRPSLRLVAGGAK